MRLKNKVALVTGASKGIGKVGEEGVAEKKVLTFILLDIKTKKGLMK